MVLQRDMKEWGLGGGGGGWVEDGGVEDGV